MFRHRFHGCNISTSLPKSEYRFLLRDLLAGGAVLKILSSRSIDAVCNLHSRLVVSYQLWSG